MEFAEVPELITWETIYGDLECYSCQVMVASHFCSLYTRNGERYRKMRVPLCGKCQRLPESQILCNLKQSRKEQDRVKV
jgi:hypothetical protein